MGEASREGVLGAKPTRGTRISRAEADGGEPHAASCALESRGEVTSGIHGISEGLMSRAFRECRKGAGPKIV